MSTKILSRILIVALFMSILIGIVSKCNAQLPVRTKTDRFWINDTTFLNWLKLSPLFKAVLPQSGIGYTQTFPLDSVLNWLNKGKIPTNYDLMRLDTATFVIVSRGTKSAQTFRIDATPSGNYIKFISNGIAHLNQMIMDTTGLHYLSRQTNSNSSWVPDRFYVDSAILKPTEGLIKYGNDSIGLGGSINNGVTPIILLGKNSGFYVGTNQGATQVFTYANGDVVSEIGGASHNIFPFTTVDAQPKRILFSTQNSSGTVKGATQFDSTGYVQTLTNGYGFAVDDSTGGRGVQIFKSGKLVYTVETMGKTGQPKYIQKYNDGDHYILNANSQLNKLSQVQFDSTGWHYFQNLKSMNNSNPRWLVDKNYVDSTGLKLPFIPTGSYTVSSPFTWTYSGNPFGAVQSIFKISATNSAFKHILFNSVASGSTSVALQGTGGGISVYGLNSQGIGGGFSSSNNYGLISYSALNIAGVFKDSATNTSPLIECQDPNGVPLFDIQSTGMAVYANNMASSYTIRALVDKNYVDSVQWTKKTAFSTLATATIQVDASPALRDSVKSIRLPSAGTYRIHYICNLSNSGATTTNQVIHSFIAKNGTTTVLNGYEKYNTVGVFTTNTGFNNGIEGNMLYTASSNDLVTLLVHLTTSLGAGTISASNVLIDYTRLY